MRCRDCSRLQRRDYTRMLSAAIQEYRAVTVQEYRAMTIQACLPHAARMHTNAHTIKKTGELGL